MNTLWVCTAGKLLQTAAAQAWEHWIATCLTSKNPGLVLQFPVLVQVPKRGFIAYWREQTDRERLLTRIKRCQKCLCSPGLSTCSQLWNKGLFEIRIQGLGSGTCVISLYMGDFLFSSESWQCPPLIREARAIHSAWASSPAWGSSNLHLACRIIGLSSEGIGTEMLSTSPRDVES